MTLHHGDCLDVMAGMDPESVDAIVTDPPYGLEFMGKEWDRLGDVGKTSHSGPKDRDASTPYGRTRVSFSGSSNVKCQTCGKWQWDHIGRKCECERPDFPSVKAHQGRLMGEWHARWGEAAYRVAKPSAYLLAFGGTRTVHRMTVALEDAGWVIRDMLVWAYASGFPKSKASLKPAWEPIVMARKPGPLRMLAIDECRIPADYEAEYGETWLRSGKQAKIDDGWQGPPVKVGGSTVGDRVSTLGRWPANVILGDAIFEPGVPGVVVAGSLTGTMTAWSSSPDSGPSPIASPASNADRRSSRGVPGVSFPASATAPVGTQLDAWGTSTDTSRMDTGCSDGTTTVDDATSGSTGRSGRTPTAPSLGATSSTTGTGTDSTTDSITSSASAEPSTPPITGPSEPGPTEWRDSASLSDGSASSRPNSSRAGEPSADRRYNDRGVADFAPLPGERRDVDGLGYSRFFLIPKADRADREPVLGGAPKRTRAILGQGIGGADNLGVERANVHPTVKPTDLMRHLVRLVTPPGGTVLDPFLGSGTTAIAAEMEGFAWVGIEREAEYVAIAEARLNGTQKGLGLVG